MAGTTAKDTYALDRETAQRLDRLARRWRVSKSEALRRIIRAASGRSHPPADHVIHALNRLQQSLRLSPTRARAWARRANAGRRSAPPGAEPRRR